MKAVRFECGTPILPFGDPVGEERILDGTLADAQQRALDRAGVQRVEAPPVGEPWIAYSDRTWFTAAAVRALMEAGAGRMRVTDTRWAEATGSLQELSAPGVYELALHPGDSQADWRELSPVDVDLGLEEHAMADLHPAMKHAARPLMGGSAQVHQLDHWSHIHRVNLLALGALANEMKAEFDDAPIWKKLWTAVALVSRAHWPPSRWTWPVVDRFARAVSTVGRGVQIHRTAVVEACVLGDGVKIGPHAVVRASVLAPGAEVEELATVNLSVLGPGARVGRMSMCNLCVLYPGARISSADGWQMSIFGRDAFAAWGAGMLDLSFGRTIKSLHRGQRVDTGLHFLGVAVGHQALLANTARVGFGVALPNGAVLVGDPEAYLRDWNDAPVGEAVVVVGGKAVPARGRHAARRSAVLDAPASSPASGGAATAVPGVGEGNAGSGEEALEPGEAGTD